MLNDCFFQSRWTAFWTEGPYVRHWWITFHKKMRPSIYLSLMSFLSMKSKVKVICLQLITCTYMNHTVLPHVEKIVRKGLVSNRSVRLGRVMRRSTLRFPSDFKIWNCTLSTQMSRIFCVLQDRLKHQEKRRQEYNWFSKFYYIITHNVVVF